MSTLIAIRLPNRRERKTGAEIVFERKCAGGIEIILACPCYDGWHQWGAPIAVLADNVGLVEAWRRGRMTGFRPSPRRGCREAALHRHRRQALPVELHRGPTPVAACGGREG